MTVPRFLAGATLLMASVASHALDFKTVGTAAAILYDAPSIKGDKLFVAPHGMPVEVILSYGEWVKVRDASGDMSWTEAKSLSTKRNVIVRAAGAKVRATADEAAPILFVADKGLLLELADPQAGGWIKVKHHDGTLGFIKATDIWGI